MDKKTIFYICILLTGVFISTVSQVMLKKSALKNYSSKIKEYINPLVATAYVLFIGTTILSVLAYKRIPLSLGMVLESTSYIYITIFGVKIFKEKISKTKVMALLFIIAGVLLYSL